MCVHVRIVSLFSFCVSQLEIVDELNETIASVKEGTNRVDMSSVLPTGAAAEASSGGTTTIGFGAPTSTTTIGFGAPASTTTVGFGSGASSAASTSAPAPPLAVKKKPKRVALATSVGTPPVAAPPAVDDVLLQVAEPEAKKSKQEA